MEKGHEICYVDVKSLHESGSLTTVTREFARYRKILWTKEALQEQGIIFFSMGK
jgi:hypothetical protein